MLPALLCACRQALARLHFAVQGLAAPSYMWLHKAPLQPLLAVPQAAGMADRAGVLQAFTVVI